MKNLRLIVPLVLFSLSGMTKAQISSGGIPFSFSIKNLPEVPFTSLSIPVPIQEALADSGVYIKTLRFAESLDVDLYPSGIGVWDTLADGSLMWRAGLYSPGAYSLNLVFSSYYLPSGAKLFLYDPSGEYLLGAFTETNNKPSGVLAVMPVPGDRLVLELNLPAGLKEPFQLVIGRVSHDYLNLFPHLRSKDGSFRKAGACNLDINCPPGDEWQEEKRAVVRLLINGNELCSGVMLNNTALDGKPYLYTAQHCVEGSADAEALLAVFNYESAYCNGPDGSVSQSVSGSTLKATLVTQDFSLVELSSMPPKNYSPWYAGWSLFQSIDRTASIHHPSGDVKKIALDMHSPVTSTYTDPSDPVTYDQNAFWRVNRWENGTTEGGSSGAPLFDQNKRVIGSLTGGEAICGRPLNDYFTKLSRNWNDYTEAGKQLKAWLAPGNSASSLDGFDPYSSDPLEAAFTWHAAQVCEGEKVVFASLSSGGINNYLWDFGEGATPVTATGRGPHSVLYASPGTLTVKLIVESGTDSDTLEKEMNLVWDSPVTAGYDYSEKPDRYIQFNDLSENASGWYWDFGDNRTPSTLSDPGHRYNLSGTYQVSQRVHKQSCYDTLQQAIMVTSLPPPDDHLFSFVRVYPVPAGEFLVVEWETTSPFPWQLTLYRSDGTIFTEVNTLPGEQRKTIDVSLLSPGICLLRLQGGEQSKTLKITVVR